MKDKLSIVGSLNVGVAYRELDKYLGKGKHIGATSLFMYCGLLKSMQDAKAKRSLSRLRI